MNIREKAIEYHSSGFNCAQAVLAALKDYTGLDENTSLAIAAGFGGGLRSGEVCGAICGADMAVSAAFPFNNAADIEAKDNIAALSKALVAAAKEQFGAVRCDEIKGDKSNCEKYIAFMAEYAEKIINKI